MTGGISRTGATPRTKVFVSYSHRDEKFRARLRTYLFQLEKAGLVDVWDDKRIEAGQHWRDEIRVAVSAAKIAILLVSIDFLSSTFIAENELPSLLRAAQEEDVLILMVFVGPCRKAFENTPELETFQAFELKNRPNGETFSARPSNVRALPSSRRSTTSSGQLGQPSGGTIRRGW